MAELSTTPTPTESSCCAPESQAVCCEPSEKDACCGSGAAGAPCGCSEGQAAAPAEGDIREVVRERYAATARAVADQQQSSSSCCGPILLAQFSGPCHQGQSSVC